MVSISRRNWWRMIPLVTCRSGDDFKKNDHNLDVL
jgi:hypothetical protein